MRLTQLSDLHAFLATWLADCDLDDAAEDAAVRAFLGKTPADRRERVAEQARRLLAADEFPLDELGSEANRWFGDADEGRAWLRKVVAPLEAEGPGGAVEVKDSNGTPLAEGDSVLVIKDLKVKGGSSDLKRGTLVRRIHLVDDPDVVECRVDGSTLVLKTCFLKKA